MLVFRKKCIKCVRDIFKKRVCEFLGKKVYKVVFFLIFFFILLNYNFEFIFLFFKNKNYLIRLRVFLIFYKVITDFLNLLNI